MDALKLSYLNLPLEIKPCFTYCSVYLKGYKMNKNCLIQLWMAQDALHECRTNKMEEKGMDYIEELLPRSLLQHVIDENHRDGVMHDLVHKLACYVSREECRSQRVKDAELLICLSTSVRHASFSMNNSSREISSINLTPSLRTIFF